MAEPRLFKIELSNVENNLQKCISIVIAVFRLPESKREEILNALNTKNKATIGIYPLDFANTFADILINALQREQISAYINVGPQ